MAKDTKLVHFAIVDGSKEDVRVLSGALSDIAKKLPFDLQFIVTNERVEMHSVKFLIEELYTLYKKNKTLKERKDGTKTKTKKRN